MNDWLQYHNPDVMVYGVDDVGGPPFTIVSGKVIVPCEGIRIWLVGRRAAVDLEIYLGGWMRVDGVRASTDPKFLYEYYGGTGVMCDPMPGISAEHWYRELLKLTGNFRFGLTELKRPSVSNGLHALASEYAPAPRKRRK